MDQLRIISTGLAVPGLVTNQDVVDMLPDIGATLEWMDKSVGIKQRHISIDGMQPEQQVLQTNGRRGVFEKRTDLRSAVGCCTSDLCAKAIRDAVASCPSGALTLEDIDMIIVSTVTPDMPVPGTATFTMEKLGLNGIKVMDVRSACCGFTTGLQAAAAHLVSGLNGVRTIAVVGAEVGSVFGNLDPKHPAFHRGDVVNAVMIGDAAACVIVKRFSSSSSSGCSDDERPFGIELLHVEAACIGRGQKPGMYIPCGGSVRPFSAQVLNDGGHFFAHDFKKVLEHGAQLYYSAIDNGLRALSNSARFAELRAGVVEDPARRRNPSAASKSDDEAQPDAKDFNSEGAAPSSSPSFRPIVGGCATATIEDVDLFIPHQANGRITNYAVGMGIDAARVHQHFSHYGNTANASLALGLHLERQKDALADGALVMCLAAESTKWLTGTIVLVWHSLSREAYAAANTSGGRKRGNAAAIVGFLHELKRWRKAFWFYIVGWIVWLAGYLGPLISTLLPALGGVKKSAKSKKTT